MPLSIVNIVIGWFVGTKAEDWTAFFTMLLFAATAALWIATYKLYREARSARRPKIIIRDLEMVKPSSERAVALFHIVNTGDSFANIIEAGFSLKEIDSTTKHNVISIPSYKELRLANGQRFQTSTVSDINYTMFWNRINGRQDGDIVFAGYVDYIDCRKIRRRSAFYRVYDLKSGCFKAGNILEREYAD